MGGVNIVGIVAYTHFKLAEQRVERQVHKAEMEELVVCNGLRSASTGSTIESDSLTSTEIQE